MGLIQTAVDLEENKIRILCYTTYENEKIKLKIKQDKFCKKITSTCTILGAVLTKIRDSATREKINMTAWKVKNFVFQRILSKANKS